MLQEVVYGVMAGIPWWFWPIVVLGAALRWGVPAFKRRLR